VGDNEGEKWTPRILTQSVRSMSRSRGGSDFWANVDRHQTDRQTSDNYSNYSCSQSWYILHCSLSNSEVLAR